MAMAERVRWKTWATQLRHEMMQSLQREITKSVDSIAFETDSTKTPATLRSVRFWQACQAGTTPNDALATAGFDLYFESNASTVDRVTFRLNSTWTSILDRAGEPNRRSYR